MLINWRRRFFIIFSILLCYLDLCTDILFYLEHHMESSLFIIILIQPGIYLIYYWLSLMLPVLCRDTKNSYISCTFSFVLKAPLYMLLCELKLMLTPLYWLVHDSESQGDRIKHNFLAHILAHSILESLPMFIMQVIAEVHTESEEYISYLSPIVSLTTFLYGIFILNLIRKMNTGGLNWIQNPKPTLQFYSMTPDSFLTY